VRHELSTRLVWTADTGGAPYLLVFEMFYSQG